MDRRAVVAGAVGDQGVASTALPWEREPAVRPRTQAKRSQLDRRCLRTGTGFGPGFFPGPFHAGVRGVERLCLFTETFFAAMVVSFQ